MIKTNRSWQFGEYVYQRNNQSIYGGTKICNVQTANHANTNTKEGKTYNISPALDRELKNP